MQPFRVMYQLIYWHKSVVKKCGWHFFVKGHFLLSATKICQIRKIFIGKYTQSTFDDILKFLGWDDSSITKKVTFYLISWSTKKWKVSHNNLPRMVISLTFNIFDVCSSLKFVKNITSTKIVNYKNFCGQFLKLCIL